MGAPHSPLGKLRRPSHQPLGPLGGETCMAAGDSVPETCSDPLLLVPHGQGRAGLGSGSGAQRTFCEKFSGLSGTEISSAPLFCGFCCSRICWEFFFTDILWAVGLELVYVNLSTPPSWLLPSRQSSYMTLNKSFHFSMSKFPHL